VQFLVRKFAARVGKQLDGATPHTMRQLCEYAWPGNIRELENVLERAVILAPGGTLEIAPDLLATPESESSQQVQVNTASPSRRLQAVERDHIIEVLGQTNWVVTGPRGAAQILGINSSTLRSRMKKLGIARPAATAG
jgi:DNA-binding NtrC family response regulator